MGRTLPLTLAYTLTHRSWLYRVCNYFDRSQIIVFQMSQMLSNPAESIERIRSHFRLPPAPGQSTLKFPHTNSKNFPEKVVADVP